MFSLNESPHKRNLHTFISTTTALLVSLLALGALVLSYNALRGVATAYGLSGWQSYVWPLLLDFALVVFSLAVVRNAILREKTLWPWTLVGLYTAATIAFNILHAPNNTVARVVAVVAPLSLFLSFETLMAQLKSEVRRHNAIQLVDDLATQAVHRRRDLDTLAAQQQKTRAAIADLASKRDALKTELVAIRKEKKNITARPPATVSNSTKERARQILAEWVAEKRKITGAALGRELGRSARLGRELKNEILPEIQTVAKQPSQNGNQNGSATEIISGKTVIERQTALLKNSNGHQREAA
ncbi:MAG TPA: DUF2637 domain-containing protein [Chloroflexi bacterium]|nr:DUF2637 domain-containing protein [Chloroflexota bacterium]